MVVFDAGLLRENLSVIVADNAEQHAPVPYPTRYRYFRYTQPLKRCRPPTSVTKLGSFLLFSTSSYG
jgi:hypothetical protein